MLLIYINLTNLGCHKRFKMQKILISIIAFKEKFWETASFKSLQHMLRNHPHHELISIYVYDNTDSEKWDILQEYQERQNIKVFYKHDSKNSGISKAYNEIGDYALQEGFNYIIFLDQDTYLPLNFYEQYKMIAKEGVDIAAPLIYENDKLLSPSKYKFFRSFLYNNIETSKIELHNNSCINSGLLVKTDFFHRVGGYDETLRLDFCDHEFIKRAGNYSQYLHIIPIQLEQDFSTNTNPIDKALFRYDMFKKDIKSFKKINSNNVLITLCVDLPHLLRLTLQYKSHLFIKDRFFKT